MSPNDPLDDLLDRWNPSCPDASGLQQDVWRRIAGDQIAAARSGFLVQLGAWFRRPAFSFLFVAAGGLAVLAFAEWHEARLQRQVNVELARQYLRVIDPGLGAPSGPDSMDRGLVWMRAELQLSPSQYERIRKLHEALSSELVALEERGAPPRAARDCRIGGRASHRGPDRFPRLCRTDQNPAEPRSTILQFHAAAGFRLCDDYDARTTAALFILRSGGPRYFSATHRRLICQLSLCPCLLTPPQTAPTSKRCAGAMKSRLIASLRDGNVR